MTSRVSMIDSRDPHPCASVRLLKNFDLDTGEMFSFYMNNSLGQKVVSLKEERNEVRR